MPSLPPGDEADEFRQFVQGALSHGVEPHGFDWYSDEEYGGLSSSERGYAFQHGRQLAERAAAACGVAPDQGWWKAHNLIEMAFERRLYAERPKRGERIATACADTALVERISVHLAERFGQSTDAPGGDDAALPSNRRIVPNDTRVARAHIRRADAPAPSRRAARWAALAHLIAEAETIVAPDADEFLRSCTTQVGAMLDSAFNA